MKTITMYELLGMVKDGNIPKRIIYDESVYQWNNIIKNYERESDISATLNWDYIAIECLNEKVEILEEKKKIPEKLDLILDEQFTNDELQAYIYETQVKLNQVIDYLKSKGDE